MDPHPGDSQARDPHAGDKAADTGTFVCGRCGETVRVHKGEKIPSCPNCGHETYGRRPEPPDEPPSPPQRKGD